MDLRNKVGQIFYTIQIYLYGMLFLHSNIFFFK